MERVLRIQINQKEKNVMAYFINDDCIACGACADACPHNAVKEGEEKYEIDPELCKDSKDCLEVCPVDAIHPVE